MIKLTYCLRRKPGMTWDEFSTYWREVHAPLVQERAEILGIKRYVQLRTQQDHGLIARLQERNGGSPEPFDGVAELWYEPGAERHRMPARPPANCSKMSATSSTSRTRPSGMARNGKSCRALSPGSPRRSRGPASGR